MLILVLEAAELSQAGRHVIMEQRHGEPRSCHAPGSKDRGGTTSQAMQAGNRSWRGKEGGSPQRRNSLRSHLKTYSQPLRTQREQAGCFKPLNVSLFVTAAIGNSPSLCPTHSLPPGAHVEEHLPPGPQSQPRCPVSTFTHQGPRSRPFHWVAA